MGFGEDIKVPKAELGQEYSSGFKRGQEFGFGELEAGQRIGEQQQRLARALQERAEGRAPSIAQMQLAQALEQQGAATQAQLASARGLSPAMAQRLALEARGQAAQAAAAQAAILRTQEQQASQALLGQQLAAMLQGRQLSAQEAAQLGGQAAEAGYRQQQLEQQRLMAEQALQQAQQQRMTKGVATGAGALLGGLAGTFLVPGVGTAAGAQIGAGLGGALAGGGDEGSSKLLSSGLEAAGKASAAPGPAVAKPARGGEMKSMVPGNAKFKGDTRSNDTVPALLSPGEIVLPRSVAQDEDAPEKAKKFVDAIKKRQKPGKKNLAQALSRIAELEARLDAMEALKDLEEEEQG